MTFVPGQSSPRPVFSPRRVRNGIKLRGADGPHPRSWLAERWLELGDRLVPVDDLLQGREYARAGQTISLQIVPGRIDAEIQGRAAQPYTTCLRIPVLDDQQWRRVIDAMADEAVYAAKLLAGELPPAVPALFTSLDLELLPPIESVEIECNCSHKGPCKHAAAIWYLLTERVDDAPLLIFTLRGLPSDELLERLVRARAILSHGQAAAHADPMVAEAQLAVPPLEQCLDTFWRPGPQLAELQHMPPPQHAPHALLRRLGPSPLGGKFPLVGLLASVYDTVSQAAIRLRDQAERIDEQNVG